MLSQHNYHNERKTSYQYANGGFYMGYKNDILTMYKNFLTNDCPDDQISLCKYINSNPKKFGVDSKSELVSNIQIYSYFDTVWTEVNNNQVNKNQVNKNNKINQGRVHNKYNKTYPSFIHTPAITFDMAYRLDYFGSRILGKKYKYLTFGDKVCKTYNKIRNYLFLIILIVLIFFIIYINYD